MKKNKPTYEDCVIDLSADPADAHAAEENTNVVEMQINEVEHDKDAGEDLVAALKQTGIDINLPDQVDALKDYIVLKANQLAVASAQCGYGLLALKERCEHGQFVKEVETIGLSKQRASECMNIASFLLKHPNDAKALIGLGKSKLNLLSSLSNEDYEELRGSNDLDELPKQTYQQLVAERNKIRNKLEEREIELAEERERAFGAKQRRSRFPEPVQHIRDESTVCALHLKKQIDDLHHMIDEMQSAKFEDSLSNDKLQAATEREAALGSVHHALAAGFQQMVNLYHHYKEAGGTEFTLETMIAAPDMLEMTTIGQMWDMEKHMLDTEKERARIDRTNKARRGKAGRPVGSKKK